MRRGLSGALGFAQTVSNQSMKSGFHKVRLRSERSLFEVLDVQRQPIGTGSFGTCYKATVKDPRQVNAEGIVAVKAVKSECNSVAKELEFLETVNMDGAYKAVFPKVFSVLETDSTTFIVQELLEGGDLFDFIVDRNFYMENLSLSEVLLLTRKSLVALEACHELDFSHLDCKPENYVFRTKLDHDDLEKNELVLIDFGAAQKFQLKSFAKRKDMYQVGMDEYWQGDVLETLGGTASYLSPEVVTAGRFSSRSDVWSVGVQLFMMLTGQRPFDGTDKEIVKLIKEDAADLTRFHSVFHCSPFLDHVSDRQIRRLLVELTNPDPANRPSSTEAIQLLDKLG
eukprot:augustus_masked-scaffold_12-processed-gene-9.47-mRNA-1 protein AED:1.00 eAED:1.00 QI:0/-1/0/0/-1/1/1/0/339